MGILLFLKSASSASADIPLMLFFINGRLFCVQKPVHSVSLVNYNLLHAKRNTFIKRYQQNRASDNSREKTFHGI